MAELKQIRYAAKYIAELFEKDMSGFDARCATPDDETAGLKNIFSFSVAPLIINPSNYWIAWGGHFDNIVGYGLQIFFNTFLVQAPNFSDMLSTVGSFYVDSTSNKVFLNLNYSPWQYLKRLVLIYKNEDSTFSTAPKNEFNPSDIFYGLVKVIPILKTPDFNSGLSDPISGTEVYDSFKIEVTNSDGRFDGLDILKFNNTPVRFSKTTNNAQNLADFNTIRKGIVSNITVDSDSMVIEAVDVLYRMSNDVCRRISTDEFSGASENIGENIPIGWGALNGIETIQLYESGGEFFYIVLDKFFLTDVTAVYDKDGVSQNFTLDITTGIIKASVEVDTADAMGRTDSRLGIIIKEMLFEKEDIAYTSGLWDISETDLYINMSPKIDLYVDGGITKELINTALKNDIAFLIQKNNGLLTLRRWGEDYTIHSIEPWLITQKPVKSFANANKNFCSTVVVNYSGNRKLVDDSREIEIFDANNARSFTANLDTVLNEISEAEDLARRFLDRFGVVHETIQLGLGVDTFEVNRLDKIKVEVIINGRTYSEYSDWIVTECNPGQDQITIEGQIITYVLTFDEIDASLDAYLFSVE